MCAWRKLLDMGPTINSRNAAELHMPLTLVSAGCRSCFRVGLPPLDSFTEYGVFCYSEIPWF